MYVYVLETRHERHFGMVSINALEEWSEIPSNKRWSPR